MIFSIKFCIAPQPRQINHDPYFFSLPQRSFSLYKRAPNFLKRSKKKFSSFFKHGQLAWNRKPTTNSINRRREIEDFLLSNKCLGPFWTWKRCFFNGTWRQTDTSDQEILLWSSAQIKQWRKTKSYTAILYSDIQVI